MLFVTNYQDQHHSLFRNLGNGFFQHAEHTAGLSAALGRNHVGWGVCLVDFDLNGKEDLFISHGHLLRFPAARVPLHQRPALFLICISGKNAFRSFTRGAKIFKQT